MLNELLFDAGKAYWDWFQSYEVLNVYQEALELELRSRQIDFESQPQLRIVYKGQELQKRYRPDLYVSDGIVVELKALKALSKVEAAQILNYLKATGKPVGYLINFGNPSKLEWKRYVSD
jgi:GxxExxY protein